MDHYIHTNGRDIELTGTQAKKFVNTVEREETFKPGDLIAVRGWRLRIIKKGVYDDGVSKFGFLDIDTNAMVNNGKWVEVKNICKIPRSVLEGWLGGQVERIEE